MPQRILVINPNSSDAVTRGLDIAMQGFRAEGSVLIDCVTLKDGPAGIETQQHADSVVTPLLRLVDECEPRYDAFVIACYSDPGLHAVREITSKPVLGIAECGLLTALTLGQRIGVIAILQKSIARHLRYLGAMGLTSRLAAELPLNMGVAELSDQERTFGRLVEVARELRERHAADVIVLGCAGLTSQRARLQATIGVPVVDPAQAAVAMAIGRVMLDWTRAA